MTEEELAKFANRLPLMRKYILDVLRSNLEILDHDAAELVEAEIAERGKVIRWQRGERLK